MTNIYLQQKAENTLKRAQDLIASGQSRVAFQELQAFISSTRLSKNRQWNDSLEEVWKLFIERCIEFRRGADAKAAILQFRTLCLPDHIQSLNSILKHFVALAEERAAIAQKQSNTESLFLQKNLEDEVPENILMSEVSGEDLKDRKDREIVTPWLRFLWETYRTVLEMLKNYPYKELQERYHDTSQRAFKFCRDYKRKEEFRRLSEMLRLHLYSLQKDLVHAKINLTSPEILQHYLDTRFKQLDVASDLELWMEAYKSIEDLHVLIKLSKRPLDPSLMTRYYEHLAKIFWVSNNYVLHSFAYYKLFNLKNSLKQKSEDLQLLASTLLLSALSIPPSPSYAEVNNDGDIMNVDFNERDKQLRMAILLGLSAPPSKELLLSEIVKKQIMSFVFPELRNVYQILEVDFHPLDLCSKMMPVFQFLQQKPELQIYVKPLQSITLSRLLFQLSKAYEVVQISKLEALAPFVTLPQVERAIVLAVQQRRLQITIDHQNSSLIFGRSVDPFDFDSLRNELTKLSKKLLKASQMMYPQMLKTERDQQQKLVAGIVKEAESEHKALLQRKQFIEKRKVYLKNLKDEEEREREEKLEKLREKRRKLEREAQERQQQKREEEIRKRKEEEEKKEKQVKLIKELEQAGLVTETTINAVAAKTGKKKSKLNIEKDVNVETIMEIKREELEKQRREKEKRLIDEAKQLDFLERARRLEEIPLLKKHYEQEKKEDRVYYEQMVLEAQENYKKEIEYIKATKAVIEKMFADKNDFIDNVVMRKRRAAYEKLLEAYNKKKEEARRAWLARRELIKKEVERIEEEKRQAQLEEKRKREEEELRRQEELKKKKEREEEEEKLRRITELQQKREREAEEKMRQQKEAALKSLAQQETEKKPYKPPSSRWESLTEKSPFGEKKRFEEKSPFGAKKRFEDERSPFGSRRKFDSEKSPFSSEKSPFGDKEGGRRRFDDNKPAFGDRKKREDESDKNKDASPSNIGGRWR